MGRERVYIAELNCNGTTEWGADEVYILAIGVHSNGTQLQMRLPGPSDHWNMNDGNQGTDQPANKDSHSITDRDLFSINLNVGEIWSGVITIMEEDGGNSKQGQEAMAGILAASAGLATATGVGAAAAPFLLGGSAILSALTSAGVYASNTDDFIGAFKIQIVNATGTPTISFEAANNVTFRKDWDNGLVEFHMNGRVTISNSYELGRLSQ
jgi:hypothetical protein